MIIFVSLLIIFGYTVQRVFIRTHKRSIVRIDYNQLNLLLFLDLIVTLGFMMSVEYNSPLIIQKVLKYTIFLVIGVFFLNYMKVLKDYKHKRRIATAIIFFIGTFIITFFGDEIGIVATGYIVAITLLSRVILIDVKKVYASKQISTLIVLLFIVEAIRFIVESAITFEMLFNTFGDLWLSAFSFTIRTIAMILIIQIHDQLSINKNIAKTLDYQSGAQLLSLVFDQNPTAIVLTDMNKNIIYANPQALSLTGYSEAEVIGKTPKIFSSGKTPKETYKSMRSSIERYEPWTGEFINVKKNGEIFIELTKIVTLKDMNNVPVFYLSIKTDITKEKEYLKKLEYVSNYDDLTGLLRRQIFLDMFEKNVESNADEEHYFILMDIDDFKLINDSCGHIIGDKILKIFSGILKEVLDTNTLICRFGGDEFAVYMYGYKLEEIHEKINNLNKRLEKTTVENLPENLKLKISLGITKVEIPLDFSKVYEASDKNLYKDKKDKKIK
ncbi:sensor domain-containing diguanylate cyclase [Acholeplasma granularum]|uniref:sensor domain-containing diguanylate cyclase n=1 Tax=Acholeplasma granularum TaxID=264635 RepID=UPI00046FA83D|nr:diguanylate cyclase [Acholeplasma granularum]